MFGAKRKAKGLVREALPQLAFDVAPAAPVRVYTPIVLEVEKAVVAPVRPAVYRISQLIAEIRQLVEGAYLVLIIHSSLYVMFDVWLCVV